MAYDAICNKDTEPKTLSPSKKWLIKFNPRYLVWRYMTKICGTDKLMQQIFEEPLEDLYNKFSHKANKKE